MRENLLLLGKSQNNKIASTFLQPIAELEDFMEQN